METKSRYEVIGELESKKRALIQEKNGLQDGVIEKRKRLTNLQRQKGDVIISIDRQIDDAKEDLLNFEKTLKEKKETIEELIKSVDDSLKRFSQLQEKS